jgi:hypothetical protein
MTGRNGQKDIRKTVPRSGSALAELQGGRAAVPRVEKSCDCAAAPVLVHYGLIVVAKATIPRRTGSNDVGVLASARLSPRRITNGRHGGHARRTSQ